MVHYAKHHEYQLVTKSAVTCFLNRVIFKYVDFSTAVCPRCAPELGNNANMGALTKIRTLRAGICDPQLQNRVGAYVNKFGRTFFLWLATIYRVAS